MLKMLVLTCALLTAAAGSKDSPLEEPGKEITLPVPPKKTGDPARDATPEQELDPETIRKTREWLVSAKAGTRKNIEVIIKSCRNIRKHVSSIVYSADPKFSDEIKQKYTGINERLWTSWQTLRSLQKKCDAIKSRSDLVEISDGILKETDFILSVENDEVVRQEWIKAVEEHNQQLKDFHSGKWLKKQQEIADRRREEMEAQHKEESVPAPDESVKFPEFVAPPSSFKNEGAEFLPESHATPKYSTFMMGSTAMLVILTLGALLYCFVDQSRDSPGESDDFNDLTIEEEP